MPQITRDVPHRTTRTAPPLAWLGGGLRRERARCGQAPDQSSPATGWRGSRAARGRYGADADVEEIIAYLRGEGLPTIEAVKAISMFSALTWPAERLVHHSQAFADERPANDAFH